MFPKKLKIELPHDPAIPLLGIYPEETKTEKHTCIPLFIAALFTIAMAWKQPKYPLTDEWIKKIWCVYTHAHTCMHTHTQWNTTQPRKRMKNATCSNMNGVRDDASK